MADRILKHVRKGPVMKIAVRIVAVALVLTLLLAVLLGAALQVYLCMDRGRDRVLQSVNSLIPGRVLAGDLSVWLPGRSVSLVDAKLLDPEGRTVLEIGRARVKVAILPLLERRLVFRLVSLETPELTLDRKGEGSRLNLLDALVKDEPGRKGERAEGRGEGLVVVIENFSIESGRLWYDDAASGVRAELDGVHARGGLDTGRMDVRVRLSAARALIRAGGRALELTGVGAGGAYHDGKLDPLFLATSYRGFKASLDGSVTGLAEEPALNIKAEYGGRLSDLASLLELKGDYSGKVSGDATLEGTARDPRARMRCRLEDGVIEDVKVESAELEAELKDRVVELKDSLVMIASGRAVAAGTLDLRRVFPDWIGRGGPNLDAASYTLSMVATDIDPSAVVSSAPALPKRVSAQVEVSGTGVVPPRVNARSSYVLKVSGTPGEWPISPGEISIRGEAGLDYPSLTYALTGTGTGGMDVDIRGGLDLESRTVQAQAGLDVREMQAVAPALTKEARGSVLVRAEISGTLERPVVSGTVRGGGLAWREYRVGDVQASGLDELACSASRARSQPGRQRLRSQEGQGVPGRAHPGFVPCRHRVTSGLRGSIGSSARGRGRHHPGQLRLAAVCQPRMSRSRRAEMTFRDAAWARSQSRSLDPGRKGEAARQGWTVRSPARPRDLGCGAGTRCVQPDGPGNASLRRTPGRDAQQPPGNVPDECRQSGACRPGIRAAYR